MLTLQDNPQGLQPSEPGVLELASLSSSALDLVGEEKGFYRELAMLGSLTPDELARLTRVDQRFVQEWLSRQAQAGRLRYAPQSNRFSLSPADAVRLRENSLFWVIPR